MFLHGSWADGSQWLPVLERLSQNYHCVAPDLLGFGDSEHPNLHYSIEVEVECLAEYLEALRLNQVYLVGHSLGGWIAASYALKYLEQVQGLILISPEGAQIGGGRGRWRWRRWLVGRRSLVVWLLQSFAPLFRVLGQGQQMRRSLQLRQQMLQCPTACQLLFKRQQAEIQAESLEERLSWLKVPVRILQGEEDTATAVKLGQAYADLAPHTDLQILPGNAESLPETLPDEVTQAIDEFVCSYQQAKWRTH